MQSAIPSQLGLSHRSGSLQESLAGKTLLVIGATAFVAACAHISLPLPFTPVPLTLQNFAVILVGMALGPVAGFSAMVLYLAEGALGLPVFTPSGGPAGSSPSARPERRLSLLVPTGRSNCRLGGTRHAAAHHTFPKRSRRRHRRDPAHLPPRRRLVRLLRPPQRLCDMVAGRRSLSSPARSSRSPLQPASSAHSSAGGSPNLQALNSISLLPTPSRHMNSAHLTTFHLQQGLNAS